MNLFRLSQSGNLQCLNETTEHYHDIFVTGEDGAAALARADEPDLLDGVEIVDGSLPQGGAGANYRLNDEGVLQLYNPTTGKWHDLYVDGDRLILRQFTVDSPYTWTDTTSTGQYLSRGSDGSITVRSDNPPNPLFLNIQQSLSVGHYVRFEDLRVTLPAGSKIYFALTGQTPSDTETGRGSPDTAEGDILIDGSSFYFHNTTGSLAIKSGALVFSVTESGQAAIKVDFSDCDQSGFLFGSPIVSALQLTSPSIQIKVSTTGVS